MESIKGAFAQQLRYGFMLEERLAAADGKPPDISQQVELWVQGMKKFVGSRFDGGQRQRSRHWIARHRCRAVTYAPPAPDAFGSIDQMRAAGERVRTARTDITA